MVQNICYRKLLSSGHIQHSGETSKHIQYSRNFDEVVFNLEVWQIKTYQFMHT